MEGKVHKSKIYLIILKEKIDSMLPVVLTSIGPHSLLVWMSAQPWEAGGEEEGDGIGRDTVVGEK